VLSGHTLDPIKAILVPLESVGAVHDKFGIQTTEDIVSFMEFLNEMFLEVLALERQLVIVEDGYDLYDVSLPDEVFIWEEILNKFIDEMQLLSTRQRILDYADSYNQRAVSWSDDVESANSFLDVSSGSKLADQFDDAVMDPYYTMIVANSPSADYLHIAMGCVGGHNIHKYTQRTVDQCAIICDANPECLAFEYGVSHGGGSSVYDAGDCQPQSSADYQGCDGAYHNLDLYVKQFTYEHFAQTCVSGNNIRKYASKSVEQCKELCSEEPDCLSFEYGVDHNGAYTKIDERECRLQSSANYNGCDGIYYNLDLYVKNPFDAATDAAASHSADSLDTLNGPNDAPQATGDDFNPIVVGAAIGALVIAVVAVISIVFAKRKSSATKRGTKMTTKIAIPEVSCSFNVEAAGSSKMVELQEAVAMETAQTAPPQGTSDEQ